MRAMICFCLLPLVSLAQSLPIGEIVDSTARAMADHYVFPEVGQRVAQHLRSRAAAGAYASITERAELASVLTKEVQEITRDRHVIVRPSRPVPLSAATGGGGGPFLARAEILPGAIGYLDFRVFPPLTLVRAELEEALGRLAETRALIIDLRSHRGGSPETVAFLCSHLLEGRVHLNSLYNRETGETVDFWTTPVSGPHFGAGKPVLILTSNRTFSAAEEFAYNLKTLRRATVVGEPTRGGAHPGRPISLPEDFSIFVATGRAINPITGTNWEGVGVQPDVTVPAAEAFVTAYRRAFEGLDLAALAPAERARLDELLQNPPTLE